MYFLVDNKNKVIFGWSAKCGCSHVKNLYWFLQNKNIYNKLHNKHLERNKLPDDIENYNTIVFIRNPYKRLVSGFLDKYKKNGEYRYLWKSSFISFETFVNKLIIKDWDTIQKHHFTQQTSEHFDNKILLSKNIKFYDISNIDYNYIENLYNIKIPEPVINFHGDHKRINTGLAIDNYVYHLNIDSYINYSIDVKYFYTNEIKQKVYDFYKNDFDFFKQLGINYTI